MRAKDHRPAVHYALGQWPKLTVFLRHGEVPLAKTVAEFEALLPWNPKAPDPLT